MRVSFSRCRLACVTLVTLWWIAMCSSTAAQETATRQAQARALQEFGQRVRAYQALREDATRHVPPLVSPASPEAERRHRAETAASIRRARPHSRPGDVFTPPVVPQFRTIVRRDLRLREVRETLATLQRVPAISLRVNGEWPPGTPRPEVPPLLLASLYPLPEELEYRFAGRHLVLLDAETGLIVDFVRDLVPSVAVRR